MLRNLLLSCLCSTVLLAQGDVVDGNRGALLDATVQRLAPRLCGAVLVAAGGRVLLQKGYGQLDGNAAAFPAAQPFAFGRLSRLLTVAAAERLVLDRKLQLDQPVGRWLKDLPADKQAIAVQDLLGQRSGLGDSASFSGSAKTSRRAAVQAIGRSKLVGKPGGEVRCAMLGDQLLAALVEEVAGQRFEDFVHRRLLQPAGMRGSGFLGERGFDRSPLVSGDGSWQARGAGSAVVTLPDLHALLLALGGEQLLPAAAQESLWLPFDDGAGCSLSRKAEGGVQLLELCGKVGKHELRAVIHQPTRSWVLLLAVGDAPLAALQRALALTLVAGGDLAPNDLAQQPPPAAAPAPPARVTGAAAQRFCGRFQLPVGGSFVVVQESDGLWLLGEGLHASARVSFGLWPPPGEDRLRDGEDYGQKALQALRQDDKLGIAAGFAGDDPAVRAINLWQQLRQQHGDVQEIRCIGSQLGKPMETWFLVHCRAGDVFLRGTWADSRRLASLVVSPRPHPFRVALQPLRADVMTATLPGGRQLLLSMEGLPGQRTLVYEDATPGPAGLLDCIEQQ